MKRNIFTLLAGMLLAVAHPASAAIYMSTEADGTATNNTLLTAEVIGLGDYSFDPNPDIFAPSIVGAFPDPALSVTVVGGMGSVAGTDIDFYEFTVFDANPVWLDIDATSVDTALALYDGSGALIAKGDDFSVDPGSTTGTNSFIGEIYLTPGTYFAAVSEFGNSATLSGGSTAPLVSVHDPAGTFATVHMGNTPGHDIFTAGSGGQGAGAPTYELHISQAVPEPGRALLSLVGIAAMGLRRRRK